MRKYHAPFGGRPTEKGSIKSTSPAAHPTQPPAVETHTPCHGVYGQGRWDRAVSLSPSETSSHRAPTNEVVQGGKQGTYVTLGRLTHLDTGSPTGREAYGDGAVVVVRGRESRPHGEGPQVL